MPRLTKFQYLSTEELLSLFSDKRDASDIIEEVCQRLEKLMDDFPSCGPAGERGIGKEGSVECPVCEATLMIEDEGEGWYGVTVK